jgi:hypothetical protein
MVMAGWTLTLVCAAALGDTGGAASPIRYAKYKNGKAWYHTIVADLSSGRVMAQTVVSPKMRTPQSLVSAAKPTAAITGTFFSPQHGRPVGEVVVNGELRSRGRRGSVLAIDWRGKAHIFDLGFGEKVDWLSYRFGLRAAVRVVRGGNVDPNPKAQKFRDARIWGRAPRTAVGIDRHGKLHFFSTTHPVSLNELGWAMVKRGVVDGINLDGGGSTLMYYRGTYLVSTQRKLNNLLVLHERSPLESLNR